MEKELQELFAEFKEEMKTHVESTIIKTVNGKIASLHQEVRDLREETKPSVEFFNNVNWGRKFIIGLAGFLAAIGGIIFFFKQIFK